ncbi:hypothetical protein ABID14_000586 [Peptoniphilus olsenii]|uniref:Uncharacterized protein n=1 Tax=Peptoniphilus olsenii TaxID=411570 RepID=A0ABV2J9L2_9FIRM
MNTFIEILKSITYLTDLTTIWYLFMQFIIIYISYRQSKKGRAVLGFFLLLILLVFNYIYLSAFYKLNF